MNQVSLATPAVDDQLAALYAAAKALTAAYRQALTDLELTYPAVPHPAGGLGAGRPHGRRTGPGDRPRFRDAVTTAASLGAGRADSPGAFRLRRARGAGVPHRAGTRLAPPAAAVQARVEAATGPDADEFVELRGMLHRLRRTIVAATPQL